MKLKVSNTSLFKRKLNSLPGLQQQKVSSHVQKLASSFENGKSFFNKNSYQPYHFNLKDNLESSLYASKVSTDLRLIFSIDEDPLFNTLEITLFDLADKNKEEIRFKKIGETIYKSENLLR